MFGWKEGLEFRRKYFGVFMCSFYLGVASCAFSLILGIVTFWADLAFLDQAKFFCALSILFGVLQTMFCFMIARGRTGWVKGMVGLFVFFFVVSLAAITYSPPIALHCLALICPVGGLYCLNSGKYRRMVLWLECNKIRGQKIL
jgi:hypothetical protein